MKSRLKAMRESSFHLFSRFENGRHLLCRGAMLEFEPIKDWDYVSL